MLYLSVHWVDFIEQIKNKSVIYTLNGHTDAPQSPEKSSILFFYEDDMDFDEGSRVSSGKTEPLVNFTESCRESYSPMSRSNEEEAEKKVEASV